MLKASINTPLFQPPIFLIQANIFTQLKSVCSLCNSPPRHKHSFPRRAPYTYFQNCPAEASIRGLKNLLKKSSVVYKLTNKPPCAENKQRTPFFEISVGTLKWHNKDLSVTFVVYRGVNSFHGHTVYKNQNMQQLKREWLSESWPSDWGDCLRSLGGDIQRSRRPFRSDDWSIDSLLTFVYQFFHSPLAHEDGKRKLKKIVLPS